MKVECKADKFAFMDKIRALAKETQERVAQRVTFERRIVEVWEKGLTREEEKQAWLDYITFEIAQSQPKRARLLFERALISLDKDRQFWLQYVRFIEKTLRDPQLVRAKFENRIRLSAGSNKFETLELMLEQALFEEEQNQIQKARKVYENLQSDIAPDCLKTIMAQLSFEKRQNNIEKAKELYFRAYALALERQASEQVAYVAVQYARYLAFKCADPNRAVDVMNQAITKCSTGGSTRGTKTLYLSYVNFLKHVDGVIPDTYTKIVAVFEKGVDVSAGGLSDEDR